MVAGKTDPLANERSILTVTPESIKDFQTCARLYDYRYNDGDKEFISRRDLLAARYENTLKKIVSFFFYKKQGGYVPSYSALLNRWERTWFPKDMSAYDIAVEQHESAYGNLASYSNDATTALLSFYETFAEDKGEPFLIDEQVVVSISDDIRLETNFDLVLRYREHNLFRIIKWSGKKRKPTAASLMTDFAAIKYAFDMKNRGRGISTSYGFYDLASSRPGFHSVDVDENDINTLLYWARDMDKEDVFPSRRDLTAYCKVCPYYDGPCKDWVLPEKVKVVKAKRK